MRPLVRLPRGGGRESYIEREGRALDGIITRRGCRRGRDERAHRAHAAGVRHGNRETGRACAGHRRQQDGEFQTVARGKRGGPIEGTHDVQL